MFFIMGKIKAMNHEAQRICKPREEDADDGGRGGGGDTGRGVNRLWSKLRCRKRTVRMMH